MGQGIFNSPGVSFRCKLQALVYDILPSKEEGAGKRCSESASNEGSLTVSVQAPCVIACIDICVHVKTPIVWGAGIAQWLERGTRDQKVVGSNPCRSGGRIFFSRVSFLCLLLFRYPFHPRVDSVTRKRPAGGELQLNTHAPYVCGFA